MAPPVSTLPARCQHASRVRYAAERLSRADTCPATAAFADAALQSALRRVLRAGGDCVAAHAAVSRGSRIPLHGRRLPRLRARHPSLGGAATLEASRRAWPDL